MCLPGWEDEFELRKGISMKMEDLAREIGLSRVTVSRVINGHDIVSPRTRKKVLDYIKQTGYQPHYAARLLTQKKSNTIGIVVSHGYNILISNIVATVLNEIARHGLEADMLLASDASTEKQALISLTRRTVDGLIVFSNFSDSKFLQHVAREHKNIVFNGPGPKGALTVRTDHMKGMQQIMSYLFELGHTRIHYLGAPREMAKAGSDERQPGYVASMQRARLKPSTSFANDVDPPSGYREAKNILLSSSPHPTAIACFNDELAFGALRAAAELGIGVPGELSITGYDGNDLFRYATPSLTTYRIDSNVIGRLLVKTLIKQLHSNENLEEDNWHEGELIVGESAGHAPIG
jgi:DNA-binding LacI/PurR family transcriptional regulator